jgi:hypothetical protein
MIRTAIAGVSASALLLIAPFAVTARPHGGGHRAHTFHFLAAAFVQDAFTREAIAEIMAIGHCTAALLTRNGGQIFSTHADC